MLTSIFGLFAGIGLVGAMGAAGGGDKDSAFATKKNTETTVDNTPAPVEQTDTETTGGDSPAEQASPDIVQTPDTPPWSDTQDDEPIEINIPNAPTGQTGGETGSLSQNPGELGRVTLDLDAGTPTQVLAGRVTTLEFEGSAPASIEILSDLAYGNVTVNPDNTLALVLTGTTDTSASSFDIRVTDMTGNTTIRTVALDVQTGPQLAGWGEGDFYMLQTDENDNVIVEAGQNHTKVYVSGSEDALSLADIAALEGIENPDREAFLKFFGQNPDYASTPDAALQEDAADILWRSLSYASKGPQSNWLLFESGYEYDTITPMWDGAKGESELHPIYLGAWGEGDRPVLNQAFQIQGNSENVVVKGLDFTGGMKVFNVDNYLFDDIVNTGSVMSVNNVDGLTLHNSSIYDVARETPAQGLDYWAPHINRESGMYMTKSDGVLLDGVWFDRNGWAEGYDPGLSGDDPQPPSMFSHNIYYSTSNLDITMRDSIIMRGAGNGAQFRSGAILEDNVFLDNNGSLMFAAGSDSDKDGIWSGNYSLLDGGVVSSAGYRLADDGTGAKSVGVTNAGYLATVTDTIITHMADPNNPEEIATKDHAQNALNHKVADPVYDEALIYNWTGIRKTSDLATDQNIEGLDTDILDQTTIQRFTADLLGKPDATISDLADHLRAQAQGALDDQVDADLIIDFFRTGFGLETGLRAEAETLRFVPNELADGVRWDIQMNWDSNDLPGTQDGDRVELGGNWVTYGGTTTIEDLDFGDNGRLSVTQGYLKVTDHLSVGDRGGELSIDKAGQVWTNGYTDQDSLTVNADGGRFVNTGLYTGKTDMNVADNAQVILASDGADYVMGQGSSLSIKGGDAQVGFDGEQGDTAILLMSEDSTLHFEAENGELGTISEFFSGHFEKDSLGVQSGANLGNATLDIDITGLDGTAGAYELMRVDELIGGFGDINITGLNATAQNAVLQIDYASDRVVLQLGEPGIGTGAVALETIGDMDDAQSATKLFAALVDGHGIYSDDDPDSIPAEEDDDPFV